MESIANDVPKEKENIIKKLWAFRKYINIEPFMIFYIIPGYLNLVALQNFPLEKACRVNYNYSTIVCSTILDKDQFSINCDAFKEELQNDTHIRNRELWNIDDFSPDFHYTVCKAEHDVQILTAEVYGNRQPIAAVFSFIVILFAGGWSDRHNKRKPFMIVPLIGEALTFAGLLISAVYFETISMEFGAYIEVIVPAMFGGIHIILTVVYSYMAAATPESDRAFRFAIFSTLFGVVPLIIQPSSGVIFKKLGYIYSFAISWAFQILAILYVIFFIDEIKPVPKRDIPLEEGIDNPSFKVSENSEDIGNGNMTPAVDKRISSDHSPEKKKACLTDFFDPTLAIECLKMPLEKRQNYEQPLLILLIFGYFLIAAPAIGEEQFFTNYEIKKLNWDGDQRSFYNTFSGATGILGTFIGTAILSKILKLSDPIIGILGTLSCVVSRPFFALAVLTRIALTFYAGCTIEMFAGLRVIAIRCIGSSIVEGDELTRMFAIFSISATVAGFIFPKLYSYIYELWLETFPGMIFIFNELFFVLHIAVFIICYVQLKKRSKKIAAKKNCAQNGVDKDKIEQNGDPQTEITSL